MFTAVYFWVVYRLCLVWKQPHSHLKSLFIVLVAFCDYFIILPMSQKLCKHNHLPEEKEKKDVFEERYLFPDLCWSLLSCSTTITTHEDNVCSNCRAELLPSDVPLTTRPQTACLCCETFSNKAAGAVSRRVLLLHKMLGAVAAKPTKRPHQPAKTAAFVHSITNLPQTTGTEHTVPYIAVATMQIRSILGIERWDEISWN